jgi:RHS repeat-associated protein
MFGKIVKERRKRGEVLAKEKCYASLHRWFGCICLLLILALSASAQASEKTTYFITNAQGTVVATMDSKANVTYAAAYRPYGKQQMGTPQAGPGYTGHVNDPEVGLVYMQQRYYDPVTARFLSVDPVRPAMGNVFNLNRYQYTENNPVVNTDPDGRQVTCTKTSCQGVCHSALECMYDYVYIGRVAQRRIIFRALVTVAVAANHSDSSSKDKSSSDSSSSNGDTSGTESKGGSVKDVTGNQPPFTGAPGSTVRGGTGSRTYGPDGYPQTDRDSPHPDEKGPGSGDHSHDWGRPEDGGPPTHKDRGPPRPPNPNDPPPPRGPNVPPREGAL